MQGVRSRRFPSRSHWWWPGTRKRSRRARTWWANVGGGVCWWPGQAVGDLPCHEHLLTSLSRVCLYLACEWRHFQTKFCVFCSIRHISLSLSLPPSLKLPRMLGETLNQREGERETWELCSSLSLSLSPYVRGWECFFLSAKSHPLSLSLNLFICSERELKAEREK